jgi:hypothetical protein
MCEHTVMQLNAATVLVGIFLIVSTKQSNIVHICIINLRLAPSHLGSTTVQLKEIIASHLARRSKARGGTQRD